MLSRAIRGTLRTSRNLLASQRSFTTSARKLDKASNAVPARRPVGAFRGGIFGFLFGSVAAGAGVYYYILEEYRVSNNILNEDIYALQSAVQRLESYVQQIESNVTLMQKKQQ